MYPKTKMMIGKRTLEVTCPGCGKTHPVEFGLILDNSSIVCPFCKSSTIYELEEETHQMLREMESDLELIINFVSS